MVIRKKSRNSYRKKNQPNKKKQKTIIRHVLIKGENNIEKNKATRLLYILNRTCFFHSMLFHLERKIKKTAPKEIRKVNPNVKNN
jgi:hypothetical protein